MYVMEYWLYHAKSRTIEKYDSRIPIIWKIVDG